MSMCLYLKSGSELELARLAKNGDALANLGMPGSGGGGLGSLPDPDQLLKLAAGRMEEMTRRHGPQVAEQMKAAIEDYRQKLAALKATKPDGSTKTAATGRPKGKVLDLHKSWHLLHYLFTGSAGETAPPGGLLLSGGKEIGEDLGYGPARLLKPSETKIFAAFLATLSLDQLNQRLDLNQMAKLELYAVSPNADELQEEIALYFPKLKDYVEKAAARGDGLLIWLS